MNDEHDYREYGSDSDSDDVTDREQTLNSSQCANEDSGISPEQPPQIESTYQPAAPDRFPPHPAGASPSGCVPGRYSPYSHPREQQTGSRNRYGNYHDRYSEPGDAYWATEIPRKSRSSATKILFLTLCILILIIASAYVFMNKETAEPTGLPFPTWQIPGGNEDVYPPQIQDDSLSTQPYTGVQIEKAPTGTGVTLSISPIPSFEPLTIQQIYQKCSPFVVGISAASDDADGFYWGSGVIFTEDGYILTNSHIIDGTNSATVTLSDDRVFSARLVGADTRSDLAVLKIDVTGLPAAEFGDSSVLEVGETVVAIGNPLGTELRNTLTDGIISAINRDIDYEGHTMTLIQTNAAVNEGNSGGPLINMYGQVVGITNMKMISYYVTVEGIAFAIPTSSIKSIVDLLIECGYVPGRPAIGIMTSEVPSTAIDYYSLPDGIYVYSVFENTDAYEKGIRVGDIIIAVEGEPVCTSSDINFIKDSYEVGETLLLTIFRNNETFDIEIVLCDMNDLSS